MTHPTNERAPKSASAAARASELAHIALRRVSGMSALLLLLVCVVFVLPAFLSFGREWEVVTDILVILILVSGVVAVAEHRRLALALGDDLAAGDRDTGDRMVHAGRSACPCSAGYRR